MRPDEKSGHKLRFYPGWTSILAFCLSYDGRFRQVTSEEGAMLWQYFLSVVELCCSTARTGSTAAHREFPKVPTYLPT
jgi:hypothetical protein